MTINLPPELEALIQQDLQSGAYKSMDDYVQYAVTLLHEHEKWLAENRSEIATKIEKGYAQAQRGESYGDEEVRAHMEEHKSLWRKNHGQ